MPSPAPTVALTTKAPEVVAGPCAKAARDDAVQWCETAIADRKDNRSVVMGGCEPDLTLRSRTVQNALSLILVSTDRKPADVCLRAVAQALAR